MFITYAYYLRNNLVLNDLGRVPVCLLIVFVHQSLIFMQKRGIINLIKNINIAVM